MLLWLQILLVAHLFLQSAAKECHTSFYIENNDVVDGKLIEHLKDLSLNECAAKCSKHKQCDAANFILSLDEKPICILLDSSKNGSLNDQPTSSIYSLRSYCQEKKSACHREWSYERFPNYQLVNNKFLLGTATNLSLSQCLNSCTRIRDCEAALYDERKKECQISKVNLNNVNGVRHYFKWSDSVDLYENNCPKRHLDTTHCSFTRINQAGFVDIFDARLDEVRTLNDCESKCMDWNKGACRSYTYNKATKQCFLSHASQKALGRSVLENLGKDLSSGEIDDCINFKLECQGKSLKLKGRSMKLFKGSIQSRKNKKTVCVKNITEDYNFEAQFSFGKCGIEKQDVSSPTFVGTLFVKEGSTNLITVHDKVLEVKCQIHDQLTTQQDMQLSFHFEVEDQNASLSLSSGDKEQGSTPKYNLEVLNADEKPTSVADMYKNGFLAIDSSDPNDQGFLVTSLVAEDGLNSVELIDSSGCVTNTSLITSLERVSKSRFKIGILFDGFPDQSSVTYQTLVKECKENCERDCNRRFYKTNSTNEQKFEAKLAQRKRRSTSDNKPKRHFILVDELYRVKRTILSAKLKDEIQQQSMSEQEKADLAELLNLLQATNRQSTNNKLLFVETTQKHSGNVWQCVEDLSCMFSTALAILQVLLIFFCTFLVYKYTKKWINYYKRRQEERRPSAFDSIYDYNDTSSFGEHTSSSFNSTLQTTTGATSTTVIKH